MHSRSLMIFLKAANSQPQYVSYMLRVCFCCFVHLQHGKCTENFIVKFIALLLFNQFHAIFSTALFIRITLHGCVSQIRAKGNCLPSRK